MKSIFLGFLIFIVAALGGSSLRASFLIDPTGGTVLWGDKTGADDDVKVGRMLGFTFSFFGGDSVATVDVSTNGNLNFSADSGYSNESLTPLTPRISPLWDDLEVVAGSGDSIVEKVLAGKYYSVTWRVHERARPSTRHAFQVVIIGAAMRVNGFDFLKDDIIFCHEVIGPTFSKDLANVGLDSGDGENIVPVPGVSILNGLLPRSEAGLLPVGAGGFLRFRPDELGSYSVTIVGNRAPRPHDDTWYTRNRSAFSVDVAANDTDPDGDERTLDSVTQGSFGAVTISADGTLRYTPGKQFRGQDVFTYTVRDPSGLTGTASVRVRPFATGRGTFEGFLRDAPAEDDPAPPVTAAGSGYLKITLRPDGGFTGSLIYGGYRKALNGRFDEWGDFTMQFERVVDEVVQTVTFRLHLDLLDELQPLTGTITDGESTSLVAGARPLGRLSPTPLPRPGPFKVLLHPDEASFGPLGIGYGSMRVLASGFVTFVGKKGDGRNVSGSGSVHPDGTFPLYVHIPGPRGSRAGALWGSVKFDDSNPLSDCTGTLHWYMPAVGDVAEIDTAPSLVGSRHIPEAGKRVLALAEARRNAAIDVGGGQIVGTLTIDAANRVIVEEGGEEKLAIAISPVAGSFRGSFVEEVFDPRPGFKTRTLNGVFLKKLNMGGGLYLDAEGNAAPVVIQPPAPE